jgi:hypothetical protein
MSAAILPLMLLSTFGQNSTSNQASLRRMLSDLSEHEFSVAVEPAQKLTLSSEPVLRWSNPIRSVDDAAVFVFSSKYRPELVATVMSYRDDSKNLRRAYELLSISEDRLAAVRSGARVWRSEKPGVSWRDVPDAPAPAATATQRRRQMHELTSKFHVAVQSDKNRYELRLLSQPLYRYESAKGKILDGALFAFVEGTDPELILAVEAGSDDPKWKFAVGRMTRWEIEVRYGEKVVGELPQITGARDAADDSNQIWDGGPLDITPDPQDASENNR